MKPAIIVPAPNLGFLFSIQPFIIYVVILKELLDKYIILLEGQRTCKTYDICLYYASPNGSEWLAKHPAARRHMVTRYKTW